MKTEKFSVSVVAQIKHGALRKAIIKRGWTQKKAADFLGISQYDIGKMINLRGLPPFIFSKRRAICPYIEKKAVALTEKLMELTGFPIEDLFPQKFMTSDFLTQPKRVEISKEIDTEKLLGCVQTLSLPRPPDEVLMAEEENEENENIVIINQIINTFDPKRKYDLEEVVVKGRSRRDVARERSVSVTAVGANVRSALRDIRSKFESKKAWLKTKKSFAKK